MVRTFSKAQAHKQAELRHPLLIIINAYFAGVIWLMAYTVHKH